MSGTTEGGRKAAATNKLKHGEDFYKRLGKAGGEATYGYGFAHGKFDPSAAGKLGGRPRKPVFIVDIAEFGEGFDQPTWKQKLLRRFK